MLRKVSRSAPDHSMTRSNVEQLHADLFPKLSLGVAHVRDVRPRLSRSPRCFDLMQLDIT